MEYDELDGNKDLFMAEPLQLIIDKKKYNILLSYKNEFVDE